MKKIPSGSPGSLYAHPLHGAPLSTKHGWQSTKGYTQGSDLSVDKCGRHEPDGNKTQDTRFIQVQAVSRHKTLRPVRCYFVLIEDQIGCVL
jgi:hypothetical protein